MKSETGEGRCGAARGSARLTAALLCAALLGLGACREAPEEQAEQAEAATELIHHWKLQLAESGDRTAAERFAGTVETMSNGRLQVTLMETTVPSARQALQALESGQAQIAHVGDARGQPPALRLFFSSAPFGMTRQELGAWLHHGGGMELLDLLYAAFGAAPLPGGGGGMTLGGWFDRRLDSARDLRGVKALAEGFAAEAYERLGAAPTLPSAAAESDLRAHLESGELNAVIGADAATILDAELHTLGGHCYYPGWQAPANLQWFLFNRGIFYGLPPELQSIVRTAAEAVDQEMSERYDTRNANALQKLQNLHNVRCLPFPEQLTRAFYRVSQDLMKGLAAAGPTSQDVQRSYRGFFQTVRPWHETSDLSAMNLRR